MLSNNPKTVCFVIDIPKYHKVYDKVWEEKDCKL